MPKDTFRGTFLCGRGFSSERLTYFSLKPHCRVIALPVWTAPSRIDNDLLTGGPSGDAKSHLSLSPTIADSSMEDRIRVLSGLGEGEVENDMLHFPTSTDEGGKRQTSQPSLKLCGLFAKKAGTRLHKLLKQTICLPKGSCTIASSRSVIS